MAAPRIVLDTNVLVSGLRSNRGRAFKLLKLIGTGVFETAVTVPLVFEYEDVLARERIGVRARFAADLIDYLCKVSHHQDVFFLWRPYLNDTKDDMVLEAAVESGSQYIVTYNLKDFREITHFGVKAISPKRFLAEVGEE